MIDGETDEEDRSVWVDEMSQPFVLCLACSIKYLQRKAIVINYIVIFNIGVLNGRVVVILNIS